MYWLEAWEMTPKEKAFVANPDNLSSVLQIHMVRRGNQPSQPTYVFRRYTVAYAHKEM